MYRDTRSHRPGVDEVVSTVKFVDISILEGVHCSKVGTALAFSLDDRDEDTASFHRGTILEVLAIAVVDVTAMMPSEQRLKIVFHYFVPGNAETICIRQNQSVHFLIVKGCDASILIDHKGSERKAKATAARDATIAVGGPFWMVPYGRKDGRVSYANEADLVPMGREKITDLLEFYQPKGLNILDLVVLSGQSQLSLSLPT
ncbi:peroxidase 30-like [Nicotiana tabacum]|uniref:Peroxidase 30-like n=1 Tax=Nicotiana tabacum TaxID=4097 RepID=A0AC58S657_TOBAC